MTRRSVVDAAAAHLAPALTRAMATDPQDACQRLVRAGLRNAAVAFATGMAAGALIAWAVTR